MLSARVAWLNKSSPFRINVFPVTMPRRVDGNTVQVEPGSIEESDVFDSIVCHFDPPRVIYGEMMTWLQACSIRMGSVAASNDL